MLRKIAPAMWFVLLAIGGCASDSSLSQPESAQVAPSATRSLVAPVADHHQHLFSPDMADMLGLRPLSADELVELLDSASIRRALVLSVAYIYGSDGRMIDDEYARVRAENDWTSAQAAQYPERLRAFCGFNPLKEYALDELARCAQDPHLRRGIKLHFGNSDVELDDRAHVEQLARVFRAANEHRMAVVLHLRASVARNRPYGAAQARVLLEELLPLAPDIPVQIAHLAGTGPGYRDPQADSALAILAEAVQQGDPRTSQLWFDVSTVAELDIPPATAALLARRIRQIGIDRVVYGSDAAVGDNLRPRDGWAAFRQIPLTEDEFVQIAGNVAPYLR